MSDPAIGPYTSLPYMNKGHDGVSQPSQYYVTCKPPPGSTPQIRSQENSNMSDLTRFQARHELLTGGLTKFSEKKGDYSTWKSLFENTTQGLHLTASKELVVR